MADAESIENVTFNSGDYLFHEGDSEYHFFIIQEGEVEVFKTKPPATKIPLAIVGPGTSLGEFAMVDRQPRSATARALTDVKAARISEEAYAQLFSELPDWAVSVLTALVERLRHTNEIVRQKGIVDENLLNQIESRQLDSSSTFADSNPFLREPGPPEE